MSVKNIVNQAGLEGKALEIRRALYKKARNNFAIFAALILVDEETGKPVEMAPIHREIAISMQKEKYAVFLACPEIGKTQLLIAYVLWCLGRDPKETIAIICAIKERSKDIISSVKKYIEDSTVLKLIFPELRPGSQWTENSLRVAGAGRRTTPSVASYAIGAKRIMGQRLSRVLLDDVDNSETVQTQHRRESQFRYVSKNVINRLTRKGQFIMLTNAWHVDDVAHRLVKKKAYKLFKIPIVTTVEVKRQWPNFPYKVGQSIWYQRWPATRIQEVRAITLLESEWRRSYFCEPLSDGQSYFRESHFTLAKELGESLPLPMNLVELFIESGFSGKEALDKAEWFMFPQARPDDYIKTFEIVHGVDLATGVKNDLSAIVTLLEYKKSGIIRVLKAEQGDWHITELLEKMMYAQSNFGGIFVVETAGIQLTIAELLAKQIRHIQGLNTQLKDKVIGGQSIASEFASGLVAIPAKNGVPISQGLEDLMAGFRVLNPQDHPSDIAMAGLFAFGGLRAIRLNSPRSAPRSKDGQVEEISFSRGASA